MSNKCFCHFNGLEVKDAKARKYSFMNANIKHSEVAIKGETGEMYSIPVKQYEAPSSIPYRSGNSEVKGKTFDDSDDATLVNKGYQKTKIQSAVNEAKEYTNTAIQKAVFGDATISECEHAKEADHATTADSAVHAKNATKATTCSQAEYAVEAEGAYDYLEGGNIKKALDGKAPLNQTVVRSAGDEAFVVSEFGTYIFSCVVVSSSNTSDRYLYNQSFAFNAQLRALNLVNFEEVINLNGKGTLYISVNESDEVSVRLTANAGYTGILCIDKL